MPKLKTVKGVSARLKVTGTGKLLGFRPGRRHLLTGKRAKTKRNFSRPRIVSPSEERAIKSLIPYA